MASANPPFTRKGPRKSLSLSGAMNVRLMQEHTQQAMAAAAVRGGGDPFRPAPDAILVNNFYQLLHTALSSSPVHLRIPESLLQSEDGHDIVLCTRPDGCVAALPHTSFPHFAELCDSRTRSTLFPEVSEFPLCIFFTASAHHKVFFSYADAQKQWISSKDPTKLMQRFVPPASRVPSKLRIVWKNGIFSRYIIRKRGIEAFLQSVNHTVQPGDKQVRSSACVSPRYQHSRCSHYIVSVHTDEEFQWELLDTELVQADRFLATVCRLVAKEHVVEVAYDVLQDYEDQYCFLNAKWAVVGTGTAHTPRTQKLRQKFSEVMSGGHTGKVPFIDLSEVTANNVKLYMSQVATGGGSSHGQMPASFTQSCFKANLDAVGDKLDSLVKTLSTERQKHEDEQKVKLESYPNTNILDSIIAKVYTRVIADQELQEFFVGLGEHAIHMIKMGFTKAFLGVDNYYFKKTVKRAHAGMGINRNQFLRFISIFTAVMQAEGVRSEDVSLVCKHLTHFADEVVDSDS